MEYFYWDKRQKLGLAQANMVILENRWNTSVKEGRIEPSDSDIHMWVGTKIKVIL